MAITQVQPGSVNAPIGQGRQESGVNLAGGVNVVKFTGLSSDVKHAAAINLATVFNGDVDIEQVILETDGTGFAAGTNVEVLTDDAIGLAVFFAESVANLGANKSVDMYTASVAKQRWAIRQGNHLQIQATVADCTGAGVWVLTVVYRPFVANALLG